LNIFRPDSFSACLFYVAGYNKSSTKRKALTQGWIDKMSINLTTFVDNAKSLRVMEHDADGNGNDAGSAKDHFGVRLALIQVGDSQGEDTQRGAYDWYPLTINGESVGELRDDANGMAVHVGA
jgi:hypothetical protein